MADNEKKFEARLDQHKSDITAQVTRIWVLCQQWRKGDAGFALNTYTNTELQLEKPGCELLVRQPVFISYILLLQHTCQF